MVRCRDQGGKDNGITITRENRPSRIFSGGIAMTRTNKQENTRSINHPRRTLSQSRKLCDGGWYPFPELSESENDEIFCARLAGFGSCYPAYPTSLHQARQTLKSARDFMGQYKKHVCPKCNGTGIVYLESQLGFDCPNCDGSGNAPFNGEDSKQDRLHNGPAQDGD